MHQFRLAVAITGGTVLAILLAGCSPADSTGEDGADARQVPSLEPVVTPPPAESIELSAAETAAALADPARAEEGVWSLLANLGLGVYTTDGGQVLTGSETGPDDFWLYDFEVLALVRMNERVGRPFSEYYLFLDRLGLDMGQEDMLLFYGDMYRTQSDNFLSQLFAEMGVQFEGDPTLSPLQEWLLLVSLLPPNGVEEVTRKPPGLARPAYDAPASQHCTGIVGDGSSPEYAVGSGYLDTVTGEVGGAITEELVTAGGSTGRAATYVSKVSKITGIVGKLLEASKIATLVYAVEIQLDVSESMVHQPHDRHGESPEDKRIDVVATVVLDPNNLPDAVDCGDLEGLGLPVGPLENAGIKFTLDDVLIEHGWLRSVSDEQTQFRILTDASGQASIYFEPKPERPESAQDLDDEMLEQGTGEIQVEVDVVSATGDFFNTFAVVDTIADVFDYFTVTAPITVEWHRSPAVAIFFDDTSHPLGRAVEAYTCDGTFWEGTYTLSGAPGGLQIDMKGAIGLTVPEGGEGSAPLETTGPFSAAGETGVMSMLWTIKLRVDQEADSAILTIQRQPGGEVSLRGQSVPFSADLFPEVQTVVPLQPLETCPPSE